MVPHDFETYTNISKMKELRFLQPNEIGAETLNDPVKCKAYFDWKYENFEEEYKVYREEKRKALVEFLDTLPPEKKDHYLKRREEYFTEFMEIGKRYDPVISKAIENKDIASLKRTMDDERAEYKKLEEKYKDIAIILI